MWLSWILLHGRFTEKIKLPSLKKEKNNEKIGVFAYLHIKKLAHLETWGLQLNPSPLLVWPCRHTGWPSGILTHVWPPRSSRCLRLHRGWTPGSLHRSVETGDASRTRGESSTTPPSKVQVPTNSTSANKQKDPNWSVHLNLGSCCCPFKFFRMDQVVVTVFLTGS